MRIAAVIVAIVFCTSVSAFEGPDFDRELEFECGDNAACRSALTEKRKEQESAVTDLEALEEQIIAEGSTLKDEKPKTVAAPLEGRSPQMVKRPKNKKL